VCYSECMHVSGTLSDSRPDDLRIFSLALAALSRGFPKLPPGSRIVPLEKAALGPFNVSPEWMRVLVNRGLFVARRRPGKTDKLGHQHGQWLVAVDENGMPIYAEQEAAKKSERRKRDGRRRRLRDRDDYETRGFTAQKKGSR
jgi:hypothetical protein